MKRVSNIYPINSDSVYTSGFNMPRFADIDGDDDYDLFVSVLYDATVPQSLMYYENIGNAQVANEIFITDDYLKTLDVGNNSSPVFADIDDDGDLDLFIGSLKNPTGSITFLENTGSVFNPSFYLSDSSFFNIISDLSITPSFGDIDNDADLDLIVGKYDGKLELYINSGDPSSPLFSNGSTLLDNLNIAIDVGSAASPFLMDVDNDSDLDLVIGGFNGKFYFYENTGNPFTYEFTLDSQFFGSIDIGDYSTPFLFDYNEDGSLDLFSGSRKGELFYFRNDGSNSAPIWTFITNKFLPDNFGGNSFPSFVDIDKDTDFDLFLGNVKGGLYFYTNSEISTVADWELMMPVDYSLGAFPNPFNPGTTIRIETKEAKIISIEIFNLIGEKVKTLHSDNLRAGVNDFYWYGDNDSGNILPSGIYFVLASSISSSKAIKVTFLK
jgi:hypothetical protein